MRVVGPHYIDITWLVKLFNKIIDTRKIPNKTLEEDYWVNLLKKKYLLRKLSLVLYWRDRPKSSLYYKGWYKNYRESK